MDEDLPTALSSMMPCALVLAADIVAGSALLLDEEKSLRRNEMVTTVRASPRVLQRRGQEYRWTGLHRVGSVRSGSRRGEGSGWRWRRVAYAKKTRGVVRQHYDEMVYLARFVGVRPVAGDLPHVRKYIRTLGLTSENDINLQPVRQCWRGGATGPTHPHNIRHVSWRFNYNSIIELHAYLDTPYDSATHGAVLYQSPRGWDDIQNHLPSRYAYSALQTASLL